MARAPTGLRLKEHRRQCGLTQARLANIVDISPSYLNLIENGKRPIGGKLLVRLARALEVDLESLDAAADRRLIEALSEIAADPIVRGAEPDQATSGAFVGRFPDWARALVTLHRAYADRDRLAAALSDRLNQDPLVRDTVHRMLSTVAAIRSSAEILDTIADIDPTQRRRFYRAIASESARLSEVSRALAGLFEAPDDAPDAVTPGEEVDDLIAERQNYFDELERSASALRFAARVEDGRLASALIEYLDARFGVNVRRADPEVAEMGGFSQHCRFDPTARALLILDSAPEATRRFQIARLAARLAATDAIDATLARARALRSEAARDRARRALEQYAAAAILAPYEPFLEAAEALRYDIDALARSFGLSFEQAAHRVVTLRRPDAEGVPFAFMRADPSGFVTKRFTLPGLPLPRFGGACPLWAIYRAFQTPGTVTRQLAEFPTGDRFMFIACAVAKQGGAFDQPRHLMSVMLATNVAHADRVVYGDGLALDLRAAPALVGPSCRLCERRNCAYRQEDVWVAR